MKLAELLAIRPGVTAVIGGGGKTTLLRTLGEELAGQHTVLLCTTTKIFPLPDLPCARTAESLDVLRQSHRFEVMPEQFCGKLRADKCDICPGGKTVEQPILLKHIRELAVQLDCARIGALESSDQPQQCSLAAA